ncbi:MAG: hypothetical protein JF616_07845 [Fibrobacteres bacterium]|nr:hypothetical protein [Fibrobacterota bacterium]
MSSRPSRPGGPAEILEQGDIFFFHRPGWDAPMAPDGEELESFFPVLHPVRQRRCRLLSLGKRRLPPPLKTGAPGRGGERMWARVDGLLDTPVDLRTALGAFKPPGSPPGAPALPPARPAGDGIYALARHGDHVHLAYVLKHPDRAGPLQRELGIEEEASFIVTVKNPEYIERAGGPDYPPELRALFQERKYLPLDPPAFMDVLGAEMLFITVRRAVGKELGISLEAQDEGARSAEMVRDLRARRRDAPVEPLFEGERV